MELTNPNPQGETKQMVFVRLDPRQIVELDRLRGPIPRSTLIRMIIEQVLADGLTVKDEMPKRKPMSIRRLPVRQRMSARP